MRVEHKHLAHTWPMKGMGVASTIARGSKEIGVESTAGFVVAAPPIGGDNDNIYTGVRYCRLEPLQTIFR